MEYRHKVFVREELQEGLYQSLRALLPGVPEDVVIGCGELMQIVCTSCARGRLWRGQANWCPTDNMNTRGWIRDRYSKVPEIQFLLRVLSVAEAMWGFTTYACYLRTYHNIRPDALTRQDWEATRQELLAQGWREESTSAAWRYFLGEIEKHHQLMEVRDVCSFMCHLVVQVAAVLQGLLQLGCEVVMRGLVCLRRS